LSHERYEFDLDGKKRRKKTISNIISLDTVNKNVEEWETNILREKRYNL